jgi:DNA-binding CsgD family transcriptional regulator
LVSKDLGAFRARAGGPAGSDGAAAAVLAIGGRQFAPALMDGLRRTAGVDHCMVFRFGREGDARCLLDEGDIAIGGELGAAYAGHFHARDPNRDHLFEAQQDGQLILLPQFARRLYDQRYRKLFFEQSGIVDKFAAGLWFEGNCFYVNFYRVAAAGMFDAPARTRLRLAAPSVVAAVARHFGLAETLAARAAEAPAPAPDLLPLLQTHPRFAGLTPREIEVCHGILTGLSSEAISARLGISIHSTLTYRRRAYERLGITSQTELFAQVLAALMPRGGAPELH